MDDLSDILKNRSYNQPSEITELKKYIDTKYDVSTSIKLDAGKIIVTVDNASLANTLRLNLVDIKERCRVKSKVIIRIGDF